MGSAGVTGRVRTRIGRAWASLEALTLDIAKYDSQSGHRGHQELVIGNV